MSFSLTPLNIITNRQYQNQWLIEGHMEQESIGMLFGAPASAKSFITMDIAFCVAAGIDWNQNKTEQGKVVYLAGEGFSGIQKRFRALEMKYQTSTNDVYFSDEPVALMDQESINAVYRAIGDICPNPGLIIIDTLHRNFGSGDENSSRDFTQFLTNITTLMKAANSAVLFVHHSGHSSQDRARGSSAIKAALDVEYKIAKKGSLVSMKCTKAKEFTEPPPSTFELVPMAIPGLLDVNGNPIEAAVLNSITHIPQKGIAALTKLDLVVLKSLQDALDDGALPVPKSLITKHPELAGKNYVHLDDWRRAAYKSLDTEYGGTGRQQANQQAFLRSRKKLMSANKTGNDGDFFWIET